MIPKLRPWQLAAVVIILCCVVIGVAVYLRRPVDLTPEQMMTYMPRQDATVFYVDLRPLRESGLLERLAGSALGEESEYKQFVARSNFDYKNDLDSALIATLQNDVYVIAKGRFDWKGLISYTASQGGTCRTGFCRLQGTTPDRIISFRAISPGILALAVSADEWAAASVKAGATQKSATAIPAQPLWVMIPGQALRERSTMPAGTKLLAHALEPASLVTFSLGPEQDRFSIAMDAVCKSDADAITLSATMQQITDLLQGMISRERQTPNAADLSGILVQGSFSRVNRHVYGHWPVPREFVESLASGG